MIPQTDKTALSYWFPIVAAAGLPVPRTTILDLPKEAFESILAGFDGRDDGDLKPFAAKIHAAASEYGYPCFLRTDHTSGKHGWNGTCFLDREEAIPARLFGIAEYSEMASLMGMPWNRWAVREFLPTKPVGVCKGYSGMPICREFRFFVSGGDVVCKHPYWPLFALEQGGAEFKDGFDFDAFSRLSAKEDEELTRIAETAGAALGDDWSVDLLETEQGWFLTDMAEAHKSYHWDECAANRWR